jgi:hypothetical protein
MIRTIDTPAGVDAVLVRMAARHNVTPEQLILRWVRARVEEEVTARKARVVRALQEKWDAIPERVKSDIEGAG